MTKVGQIDLIVKNKIVNFKIEAIEINVLRNLGYEELVCLINDGQWKKTKAGQNELIVKNTIVNFKIEAIEKNLLRNLGYEELGFF